MCTVCSPQGESFSVAVAGIDVQLQSYYHKRTMDTKANFNLHVATVPLYTFGKVKNTREVAAAYL